MKLIYALPVVFFQKKIYSFSGGDVELVNNWSEASSFQSMCDIRNYLGNENLAVLSLLVYFIPHACSEGTRVTESEPYASSI